MAETSFAATLAKKAITAYVETGQTISPPDGIPHKLREPAGVFVSLKKEGRLRGCIGTIYPTSATAAEEITRNAILAATQDPRFPSLTRNELTQIEYSVDILGRPEPVKDASDLDPEKYGVIVECGNRKGVLLPNLEGVDTVAEQLAICRQKAGLSEDVPVTMSRFTVTRYK